MVLFLFLLPIVTAIVVVLGIWLGWIGWASALAILFAIGAVWFIARNIRVWWPAVVGRAQACGNWLNRRLLEIGAFISIALTIAILGIGFYYGLWPKLKAEAAKNAVTPVTTSAPVSRARVTKAPVVQDLDPNEEGALIPLNPACKTRWDIFGTPGDSLWITTDHGSIATTVDDPRVTAGRTTSLRFKFRSGGQVALSETCP